MEERESWYYKRVRRQRNFLFVCLILLLILFMAYYIMQQARTFFPLPIDTHPPASYMPPEPIQKMHITGGFSANTTEKVVNASADGIGTIFYYGNPPSQESVIGQQLQSLHMHIVDGFISSNMYYYECQRLREQLFPPSGVGAYCGQGIYPMFDSEDAFLATIAAHLKQAAQNQLIIAYWVLDDWIFSDSGSARPLLIKIHQLIQQITPGRAAICGFGGDLFPDTTPGWGDWQADNFSPEGCNAVGIYIYTTPQPDIVPAISPQNYDWSMSNLLPIIFTSLQKRGWNITKEPLIGITQAFGGPISLANKRVIMPTSLEIEAQSRSFCEHGAIGITYYGWSDSWFGINTQTPMTSSEIETGIKQGIAACNQYW